jgi:hypothetical protein
VLDGQEQIFNNMKIVFGGKEWVTMTIKW